MALMSQTRLIRQHTYIRFKSHIVSYIVYSLKSYIYIHTSELCIILLVVRHGDIVIYLDKHQQSGYWQLQMYLHKLNSYLFKYCHQSIQTFWAFCTAVNFFQYIHTERERHTGHIQAPMNNTHKPSSMETRRGWGPSGWQNDQSEGFTWPQSVIHT